MGEPSVILRGKESPAGAELLHSTVHGAGRVMSRRQAVRQIDFRAIRAELVAKGIELRGAAADEAPDAYKRLDDVLAAHADTVDVLHRLTPIGVAMAGRDMFDPYRD
jgi:tRNA-splicing ligase RtcB